MLQYLNGIGGPRRKAAKSGGGGSSKKARPGQARRAAKKAERRQAVNVVKKVIKNVPKNPRQAILMADRAAKRNKLSPLNAIRLKKAAYQTATRKRFEEEGEPFQVETPQDMPEEVENYEEQAIEEGQDEATETEFPESEGAPDSEEGGADMGVIYPGVEIGGKARKAKKAAKTDKKKSSAELKRAKGQAKIERARQGGGKAAALLNKGLDTAQKYLDKKGGKGSEEEEKKEPGFFEKNKTPLMIGGGLLLLGVAYKALK